MTAQQMLLNGCWLAERLPRPTAATLPQRLTAVLHPTLNSSKKVLVMQFIDGEKVRSLF